MQRPKEIIPRCSHCYERLESAVDRNLLRECPFPTDSTNQGEDAILCNICCNELDRKYTKIMIVTVSYEAKADVLIPIIADEVTKDQILDAYCGGLATREVVTDINCAQVISFHKANSQEIHKMMND